MFAITKIFVMAVIGINYEASNGKKRKITKYKSVRLHYRSKKKNGEGLNKEFDSGDFIKDWYQAKAFYLKECGHDQMFSHSSSVDHFFMDGAVYTSAYLLRKKNCMLIKRARRRSAIISY